MGTRHFQTALSEHIEENKTQRLLHFLIEGVNWPKNSSNLNVLLRILLPSYLRWSYNLSLSYIELPISSVTEHANQLIALDSTAGEQAVHIQKVDHERANESMHTIASGEIRQAVDANLLKFKRNDLAKKVKVTRQWLSSEWTAGVQDHFMLFLAVVRLQKVII